MKTFGHNDQPRPDPIGGFDGGTDDFEVISSQHGQIRGEIGAKAANPWTPRDGAVDEGEYRGYLAD